MSTTILHSYDNLYYINMLGICYPHAITLILCREKKITLTDYKRCLVTKSDQRETKDMKKNITSVTCWFWGPWFNLTSLTLLNGEL